ncbi:MAG: NUDIX domain-containing protein [Proteobacteria bacterium]|nr:NUDIX domain-containing protein [Pseudomonadota bacterium]
MAKEMVDIFDDNYNHIGTADKDEAHNKGLWHRSFHCWIIQESGKILLQLMSKDKSSFPSKLDISAAGHLSAGESPLDGVREIEEEIGLKINPEELSDLGTSVVVCDIESDKIKPFINREFTHTYLYKSKTKLEDYIMQEEEVDGLFELDVEDGLKLFSEEVSSITVNGILRGDKENTSKVREVTIDDFVPHSKNYFLKIFIMAERLKEGKKYLAI